MIDRTERICNDCGKPFYEEDLDEEGLCEECRAIADCPYRMKLK